MSTGSGLIGSAALLQTDADETPTDVASDVRAESAQNFQIHDSFADDEKKDEETVGQVKANRDMTALIQTETRSGVANEVAMSKISKQLASMRTLFTRIAKV